MNSDDPRIPEVTRLHDAGYSPQAISIAVRMARKNVERIVAEYTKSKCLPKL